MADIMREVEVLRAACCIAGLDGEVTEKERQLLEKLADQIGVGSASLNAMISRARRDQDFYDQQFQALKGDADQTVERLLVMAMADGSIAAEERIIVGEFAERLGMSDERFAEKVKEAEAKHSKKGLDDAADADRFTR